VNLVHDLFVLTKRKRKINRGAMLFFLDEISQYSDKEEVFNGDLFDVRKLDKQKLLS